MRWPETVDPKKNGQITNYELISTGPFYLSLLYGCTGTYDQTILGYYYYKEKGKYTDLVMVDLMDVLRRNVSKPALVIELKFNNTADTAIDQIKHKQYPAKIAEYTGDLILVGISYDKKKAHDCAIERLERESGE